MDKNDSEDFADAIKEVLRSYNQEVSTFQLKMWWAGLKRFDLNIVLNALGGYIASPEKCKFAPKPGDIVEMIEGSSKDREALAAHAWQIVMDNCNGYMTTVFDSPAIHYALKITFGNWQSVGQCEEYDLKFKRLDFIKAFSSFKEGMPFPAKMVGTLERDNAANGQSNDHNAIEYVGDKEKCLAIESSSDHLKAVEFDVKGIGSEL